ncbi:RloB domain-containing protein [Acetivibrio mesophilus]|uniref:RloB domain-containing protein n=1 Tax=Acetivibrio mesophilus TaxID=2487273 RepID=A0A4Q0I8A6_9FIRM|nr:RloB domain-containing protein [Acetivibrio mesophilus]
MSSYKRQKKYIRPSPFFLIVCEGEVTEDDYFKSFPYYGKLGAASDRGYHYSCGAVYIESGAGQHERVVSKAHKVWVELKKKYGTISPNEVWCVFDCDGDSDGLNRAIQAARAKKFNAIYSVQCFELWFLLHFQMVTGAINKTEYDKKLSEYLGICYTHGTRGMYELLKERQDFAIRTARRLWEQKEQMGELQGDPITNVFLLAEALNSAYEELRNRQSNT